MTESMYDITIIGGGPAGLFAGFYAGMRTAKTQIIESLPQVGGQLAALYPEKRIHDVGGYAGIKAAQLAIELERQVQQMDGVTIKLNETVLDVYSTKAGYHVVTNQREYDTKSIVIATGNGAFNPRKLAIDNAEKFEGRELLYHVPDLERFTNQKVVVAGGGDSAIDIALMLESVAKEVVIVHRRDQFRGMERSIASLQNSSVTIQTPYLIHQVEPANQGIRLGLKKVGSDATEALLTDFLIVNYGFTSSNKIIKNWQIKPELTHRMFNVDGFMATNLPNVYAIGDGIEYPGKLRLIATAFGEGPMAISQIMDRLYPGKRGPLHSTSMFEN